MSLSQRQKNYLHLMGIPVYSERAAEVLLDVELEVGSEVEVLVDSPADTVTVDSQDVHENTTGIVTPDIETPIRQHQVESVQEVISRVIPIEKTQSDDIQVSLHDVLKRSELPEDWSDLIDHVSSCTRCSLHETRTQTVFGTGNIQADWMIIGEAPGAEEDKAGLPFLGKHGDLLTAIIESIGLSRESVYISNSIKCRPPANRDAKKSELAQCRAYIEQQIALVDPKIILCVGRVAAQNLLQSEEPISRLRNKIHAIQHPVKIEKNIPVIVTYHPAYLLRSPSQKRKVWDDIKLALSVLPK